MLQGKKKKDKAKGDWLPDTRERWEWAVVEGGHLLLGWGVGSSPLPQTCPLRSQPRGCAEWRGNLRECAGALPPSTIHLPQPPTLHPGKSSLFTISQPSVPNPRLLMCQLGFRQNTLRGCIVSFFPTLQLSSCCLE